MAWSWRPRRQNPKGRKSRPRWQRRHPPAPPYRAHGEGGAGEVVAATPPRRSQAGKLTEEDKAAILELAANGVHSNMQIADALGLRAQSVALFLYRQKSCPAPISKVPDAGVRRCPVSKLRRPWRSILQRPSPWRRGLLRQIMRPGWWHRITAELNSLGYRAPWTAEMDYLLVEGLDAGVRKEILADTLGVDSGQIKQRFVALTPSALRPPTISVTSA